MSKSRIHEISSPISEGDDGEPGFILSSMEIAERMSSPYKYTLDLVSTQFDIDPNELLGKPITLTINVNDRQRYFHGLVGRLSSFGRLGSNAHYRVELRPWFWFLGRTANCRIFQEKSVPEIFEEVARETHGFGDFRDSLSGSYPTREYCVQYRESDFDFLSRLLEEEGIFYYFEHEEDKHTLVLGDSKAAYKAIDAGDDLGDKIPYRQPGEAQTDQEHISIWHVEHQVQSGTYVLDDFDFTKPSVDLEGSSDVSREHDNASFEVYDYPGRYVETSEGERLAKIRLEELQSSHKRLKGSSDHRSLCAGYTFNLIEHPKKSENGEYLVLDLKIKGESAEIEHMRQGAENVYEVEFNAYPSDDVFRPPRRTRKPVVRGPQTAIVVGKESEDIWTDKYGRVKVQFHWDRLGESDENSSCWVRVSQLWAGKEWGGIHIPRIGQEVVVDFLEGDPDRPLITGRVYNEEQMPPYTLPDNQTQSGILSRSTKDGTKETANELRFEDKKDEEEVYFHAEKDFTRVVENDDVLKIGFEKMDPGDQTTEIYNDQKITIGQNRTAEIEQGDDSTTVSQGDHSTTVSSGDHSIGVSAGQSTIEAAKKITLKVGGSTITIEPAGITIKSTSIKVEGSATTDVKGAMTTIEGSGMATVKGGLVKIN